MIFEIDTVLFLELSCGLFLPRGSIFAGFDSPDLESLCGAYL